MRVWWRGCLAAAATTIAALLAVGVPSAALADNERDEQTVRHAIEAVLDLDTGRDVPRLPRVTIDEASGDLTIIFAMRRPLGDDPVQIVASATDDAFNILWATFTSADAARVRSATVLGTYAVVGRYEHPREIPLVRAVLSADRAAQLDWTRSASVNPHDVLDLWWVEGELPDYGAR